MGVRGPLCQTSTEKGVEDLATMWYPKFVKWSPTRKRSERLKLGDGNVARSGRPSQTYRKFSRPCRESCDLRKERELTKIHSS